MASNPNQQPKFHAMAVQKELLKVRKHFYLTTKTCLAIYGTYCSGHLPLFLIGVAIGILFWRAGIFKECLKKYRELRRRMECTCLLGYLRAARHNAALKKEAMPMRRRGKHLAVFRKIVVK